MLKLLSKIFERMYDAASANYDAKDLEEGIDFETLAFDTCEDDVFLYSVGEDLMRLSEVDKDKLDQFLELIECDNESAEGFVYYASTAIAKASNISTVQQLLAEWDTTKLTEAAQMYLVANKVTI